MMLAPTNLGRWSLTFAVLTFSACGGGSKSPTAQPAPAETGGSVAPSSGGTVATDGGSGGSTGGGVTEGGSAGAAGTSGGTADVGGAAGTSGGGTAGWDPALCPPQSGVAAPAGSAELQPAGALVASTPTRPQLTEAEADAQYTILAALAHGGTITVAGGAGGSGGEAGGGGEAGSGGAGGAGETTFSLTDNWDPVTDGIGDVSKIVPGYTVSDDGSGTTAPIQAAITAAGFLAGCPRVYIRIMPGTYRGVVSIANKKSAPPLTLYSTESDASRTVIINDNAVPIVGSISSSATVIQNLPSGFQAKNLTIANDYVEGSQAGNDQAAVALINQGDKSQYENVRFLANRFTLYVKSQNNNQISRTYFRDCYIEGDEDFIAGRGTAVFDHCEIHSLGSRIPDGGIIGNPSTDLTNPHGLLFVSSQFTADAGATGVLLGHQWYEGSRMQAIGKMIVRNSTLGAHIRAADPWAPSDRVTEKNPDVTSSVILYTSDDYYAAGTGPVPPERYLGEYGNSGPGAAP